MTAQSPLPRLMVVAGYPPEKGAGGGVILRGMLANYPSDSLCWFNLNKFRDKKKWWRTDIRRAEPVVGFRGLRYSVVRKLYVSGGYKVSSAIAARSVLRAASRFGAQVIWYVLDSDTVFACEYLMSRVRIPVHVSVHDDPGIAAEIAGFHQLTPKIEKAFSKCWGQAASRDCISERMADAYSAQYGLKPELIVRRGIDLLRMETKQSQVKALPMKLNVVMGGDTAVQGNWPDSLVKALKLLTGRGLDIEFHGFDARLQSAGAGIVCHGQMPEPDFDRLIETMHIGYAADPLTDLGRRFASSSFPTKIITYLGVGLPFVYQGPKASTVGDLLAKYKAGVIVESDVPTDIATAFDCVVKNFAAMRSECFRAARSEFNLRTFQDKLFGVIKDDVDRSINSLPAAGSGVGAE